MIIAVRVAAYTSGRIGFAIEVPMLGQRGDEGVGRRPCHPPVRSPAPDRARPTAASAGMPAFSSSSDAAPSARIGLQCRYWSFRNSSARPSAARRCTASRAVRQHDAVEQDRGRRVHRHVDLDRVAGHGLDRAEASADEPRHRARREQLLGKRSSARRRRRRRRPESRRGASRMLPSPGRANSDSAGDSSTSGVTSVCEHLRHRRRHLSDAEAGRHRFGQSGATFISPDTIRSRTAGVCTRDSSKRKALMMCVFSTGVWLFQNSVAWV